MCFAPQQRALVRHLNFQKCSGPVSFLHFWLRHVLRATTARTCSTSTLRKVVRTCSAFNILTSKCASRHFSFLISPDVSAPAALASLPFDPPEPQIIGKKHNVSRLSYLFSHLHLLSSYSFSSTLLSSNLSLLFFDSYHLCFSSAHIVGSLTSKLPSVYA